MYTVHKSELPSSELGDDRCFQIKYYGHGDILVATWNGSIELDPSYDDGLSIRFGFTHGSDAVILASLAGYLKRHGRSDDEIRETMRSAGAGILQDSAEEIQFHRSHQQGYIHRVAKGEPLTQFDIPERELSCLAFPVPTQPGRIEDGGGTGIYTKRTEDTTYLVFAGLVPVMDTEGKKVMEVNKNADFCEHDIPTMARLVCELALGEYRKDLQQFLTNLYTSDKF